MRYVLLFFCLIPSALATSFGPISVSNQVQNSQYIVHGRIIGASWVMEDRQSRRPYTFWKLQVIEQSKGEPLGQEVVIRQPGGELGGLGYHVAGTATFRDNEEVFVNLRDTDEPGIKEVMGLASGKYTVERGPDGKQILRSGLGFVVKDDSGIAFSPETFLALVERVTEGKETERDRSVFVTKEVTHDQPTEHHLPPPLKAAPQTKEPPPAKIPDSPQENPLPAEEQEGTSVGLWLALLASGLAALAGFLILRR